MKSNEQKLIDIMFEIALTIHNDIWFLNKNNKEVCEWIRDQLKKCGFETMPLGNSWEVLLERSI